MAKIQNLVILNPSDKTRMYSVVIGKGAPADADEPLVVNVKDYPVGSQFTDLTGKKLYVRVDNKGVVADWVSISATE